MTESATFAGGCFWCMDAIFRRVRGVADVQSGFAGGEGEIDYNTLHSNPKGYAEAINLTFDPEIITYPELLDIFWHMHNPTQANGQGPDMGQEYRPVIFYHSPEQQKTAESSKQALEGSGEFKDPIVTEIKPFTTFVAADEDHQNFYNKNKLHPYCMAMIDPKLAKLKEKYFTKLADAHPYPNPNPNHPDSQNPHSEA